MARKKHPPIQAKPREPLTVKRKAAIHKYVEICVQRDGPTLQAAVERTLKAERMKAEELYDYLSRRHQVWDSRWKHWRLKRL